MDKLKIIVLTIAYTVLVYLMTVMTILLINASWHSLKELTW